MILSEQIRVRDSFLSLKSIRKTSAHTGYSRPTVKNCISKFGLSPKQRRYDLSDSVFSSISSFEDAYWLGFLLADGNISYRDNKNLLHPKRLTLSLQKRDGLHLLKFKDFVQYDGPILDVKRYDKRSEKYSFQSSITINSSNLCKRLLHLGWRELKVNGDIKILENVQDELKIHLLRGLFDGDGGFVKSGNHVRMYFVDRYPTVVEWYQQQLVEYFGFNKTKIFHDKKASCSRLQYVGNVQVLRFLRTMYSSGPFLNRKFESFKKLIDIQ